MAFLSGSQGAVSADHRRFGRFFRLLSCLKMKMMERSIRFYRSLLGTVSFILLLVHCSVNAQEFDEVPSNATSWSISDVGTTVASLILENEDNANAILITHILHQNLSSVIQSWSFLSFVETRENEFVVSIVVCGSSLQQTGEVVWTANRDKPVSRNGILELQGDGNLVLSDSINGGSSGNSGRIIIWSTNTGGKGVTAMRLFGGGVLQIVGEENATVWQSSDYPTDTLLFGQFLRVQELLVSRSSAHNLSSGNYRLQVNPGSIGLYVGGSDPASSELYWMWNICNKRALTLNPNCTGISFNVSISWPDSSLGLKFVQSTTTSASNISSFTPNYYFSRAVKAKPNSSSDTVYIRLDYDGNLRGYASGLADPFQLLSEAMSKCQLPNSCGNYGVCSLKNRHCKCPNNGTHHIGSEYKFNESSCELSEKPSCTNVDGSWQMFALAGIEYYRNRYAVPLNMPTVEKCSDYCLNNCSCKASFYVDESKSCFVISSQLGTVAETLNKKKIVFIKVLSRDIIKNSNPSKKRRSNAYIKAIWVGVSLLVAVLVLIVFCSLKVCRNSKPESDESPSQGLRPSKYNIPEVAARKFSFKEIRKLANNFDKVLGYGGFGTVYEGVLEDGRIVAVKRLEIAKQGEQEFYSEIAILGTIHHWNLVQLLGFCAQGNNKILVYEYMPNGSLDEWLFDESKISFLTWPIRFNIILGTARGLIYLHQECRYKIIHLDVKPQNILLDENFVAKVSDFGLATLMSRKDSGIVTTMRGTPGYIAPEWLMECAITEKSDVYSFGMVVLEIIGGRKNYIEMGESAKSYFPAWAFSMAVNGRETDVIDSRIAGDYDFDINEAIGVLKIGLLCIHEDPHSRPSMRDVLQMLEGEKGLPDLHLHDDPVHFNEVYKPPLRISLPPQHSQ